MKKLYACLLIFTVLLSMGLSGCGEQSVESLSAQSGKPEETVARAMRFEITDAAKEELQQRLEEKESGGDVVFRIDPVRG